MLHQSGLCAERNPIKRLPVLRNGRVVGLISRANLFGALASVVRMLVATVRKQCAAPQD
jgi:signal-transduction protein with cAMP-binding, CBS, and nucleotidyltransferase domain